METSKDANIPIPVLIVLYDFRYTWKDSREICVKKGEKLLLLEKTNKDWWQVVRPTERKSFFVPAQYVELIVKEKQETRIAGFSAGADCDDSVLYENLDSLKQQVDLPSLSNVRKSDAVTSSKFAKDEKEKKSLQDIVKQKPVPKTRTKVSASRSSEENPVLTKSTTSNAKYSYLEGKESDMLDKSDKSKIGDKKTKDFVLSLPKELNPSGVLQGDKNHRGKGAAVAVENLVYCNVPLGGDDNLVGKPKRKAGDVENQVLVGVGKNRMKNSYNLKSKPVLERQAPSGRTEIKQCAEKEKSKLNQSFSKSLEKLAEEIQFEPKKVSGGSKSLSVDNYNKTKAVKMPNLEKKQERKGKTNDASIVLDENKFQPQSRSVFSRFRRSLHHSSSFKSNNLKKLGKSSKKACELSLSWEGGLDKIQEKKESEEKPQVTPLGLQRSRTFMFAERSPLSMRPANKIFSGKHRLDTAYHSQRKPEEKVTLSTFKPIFNLDISQQSPDPVKKVVTKEITKYSLEREKFQGKQETQNDAESKSFTKCKTGPETKSAYVNVGKVFHNADSETRNKSPGREGLTFYTEPYSNSESEDNLEEKSLATIAYKSLRSQSSIESNITVSEGTDPSESDENGSLDFKLEKRNQFSDQVVNKRRTSLVRSSRVESSKVRKVTARLPPTPPPEQKPTKDLGEGWGAYVSKGGRSYYYNEKTGEKNWKPPRRTINAQEKRLGSHESVCSDVNRSDTSSPLNENCHLLNSLNRSNGSLHSKSGLTDNASFDTTKSGSLPLWKEDSPDDLNRSSYNSSPITGLSQSSTYSLNKSSRDSLNRFSPIENIPSEEEGLELHDHVYQDDRKEQTKSEVERRSKCSERMDTSTFRIKPGWEEFYDENLEQIYYMYRDRKEKSVEVKDFSQSASEEDLFSEILNNIKNDIIDFEKRMTYIQRERQSVNDSFKLMGFFGILEPRGLTRDFSRKSLPANFAPSDASSEGGFVTEKPPLAPKRRKHRMDRSLRSPGAQNRRARKTHLAKVKAVAIPTVEPRTKTSRGTKEEEDAKSELSVDSVLEIATDNEDEGPDNGTKKPLPFPVYNPELEYEINELLMMQRVTESSKERRRISTERKTFPVLEEPSDVQGFVKSIPGRASPISAPDRRSDFTKVVCGEDMDAEGRSKVKEFLESRKKKAKFQVEVKIPLKLREDVIIDWENDYENLNEPVVLEGKSIASKRSPYLRLRNKIHLNDYLKSSIAQLPRDCSDDETTTFKTDQRFDVFDLASASSTDEISSLVSDATITRSKVSELNRAKLPKASPRSKITDIVTRCDKILRQNDPKSDTETFDKISVSSISDGLNSYSDFESDMNETLAVGEMWCNEKSSDENISLISWDVSEDASKSIEGFVDDDVREDNESRKCCENKCSSFNTSPSPSDSRLDTIVEDDEKITEKRNSSGLYPRIKWKSASETNLNCTEAPPTIDTKLSKSLDFFRDSLAETRLLPIKTTRKHDSITSDVCEWMARIRGIAFAEDRLFSDDDEWILSFDSEERAYFFEETSKKSLWALPDYPSEDTRPEFNFSIQRSATESAISNDSIAKLRIGKDGGKSGRISASTRSSKAQSMLIEPKFDLSKDGSKTYSMPRDLSKIYGEIIRFGVLNKTKISENGKKLRKNWTPAFVVLTESYLFFFKDAKSFQNMKNVISPNVNHMCLSLQGAVIEKGDKISSRKNVYKISCSDNTDVLIQTDKTPEAEEWFKKISSVIQNLPQDSLAVSGSPVLDLNSPSKVGRTKSLKVRSKETGSMEDLSSTPEERQNKIKARLKKFFIRRPTVDSLKKKGIWKDEPVFGCSLEQITKNKNPRVPIFVEKCIECIESKEENMKTDGLYRASGNLSQVQKIRLEVDQNNLSIMKDEEDVHVLTGSLKLFFRELKEPLIPSKQLEPALLATGRVIASTAKPVLFNPLHWIDKQLRKERIKDFQKIVKSLPTPNYDTLKFLLQHLLRVKEYHKFNRMNINNLAIVFGPTLMWPEQESANMALELMQQNVVIECLLKEFQEIFT